MLAFGAAKHTIAMNKQQPDDNDAELERQRPSNGNSNSASQKGKASSLRAKFEQLAVSDVSFSWIVLKYFMILIQGDDRVKQERDRRQREDEALRQNQEQEEIERQKKIAVEWKRKEELEQEVGVDAVAEELRQHEHHHVTGPTRRHPRTPVGAVPIMPGMQRDQPPMLSPTSRRSGVADEYQVGISTSRLIIQ